MKRVLTKRIEKVIKVGSVRISVARLKRVKLPGESKSENKGKRARIGRVRLRFQTFNESTKVSYDIFLKLHQDVGRCEM